MSIGKLAAGQESYYLELATGVEDFYTTPEAPGSWTASSSRLLGLSQIVDGEDLRALLAGRHPATGETLSLNRPSQARCRARSTWFKSRPLSGPLINCRVL